MSDKPGIPSWQRAQTPSSQSTPHTEPEPASEPQPEANPALGAEDSTGDEEPEQNESDSSDSSLSEQASRFLEDPAIRDAPREKKIAFLESKGVHSKNIEQLLGASIEDLPSPDITEAGERAWSTAPLKPPQPPAPKPQPRDVPPIVTYPEFLTQSESPPPLITTKRLLNTAYITGGLAATMYGLSKYIIAPMSQNLAEKRHEFATHTQEQLEELNKRLRDTASVDPASKPKAQISDIVDDISEADSDPTELFHRDYGTQTTPSLSRRPSVSSSPDTEPIVTSHENRLKIMASHLKELDTSQANNKTSSDALQTKISDLTTYLSEMSYQNQYYSGMGGYYANNYGLPKSKDGKDDQIEVLKSDIRAVKGVFLSARNFPAGGRSTPPLGKVGG